MDKAQRGPEAERAKNELIPSVSDDRYISIGIGRYILLVNDYRPVSVLLLIDIIRYETKAHQENPQWVNRKTDGEQTRIIESLATLYGNLKIE